VTAPAVLWQLVRLIHRRGIEVVNVHYPGPSAAILVALRRLTGIRLVTSVHGSDLTSLRPESRELDWIAKLLRQSNAIIAPSSAYGDFVRREFPGAAGRVVAVPNGVDVDAIEEPGKRKSGSRPSSLSARPRLRTIVFTPPWVWSHGTTSRTPGAPAVVLEVGGVGT
jgi:glycosyltransferase involved in cell wall biosynthesis